MKTIKIIIDFSTAFYIIKCNFKEFYILYRKLIMFFNIWGINYAGKIVVIVLFIVIFFYTVAKIMFAINKKVKANFLKIKDINNLLKKIDSLSEMKKFNVLKKNLNLHTSYNISIFTNLSHNRILQLLKSNDIEKINNLIINKLKGKKKII